MACFIVQHGLDAFRELPNYIWKTDQSEEQMPHNYNLVCPGDRWVAYAYTDSDKREKRLSLVTGFFECISRAEYGHPPQSVELLEKAWFIKGKSYGDQPDEPVGIASLESILGKNLFRNQAIIPISDEDFEKLQKAISITDKNTEEND